MKYSSRCVSYTKSNGGVAIISAGGYGSSPQYPITYYATYIYHVDTNTWTNGPNSPTGFAHVGMANLDGRIYILGGTTGISGTWIIPPIGLELVNNQTSWERLPEHK